MDIFIFVICLLVIPDQAVAHLVHVCGISGAFSGQNASMDSRMQGLHSAPQHLWVSSQLRHIPAVQQTYLQLLKKTR